MEENSSFDQKFPRKTPQLVASTGSLYNGTNSSSRSERDANDASDHDTPSSESMLPRDAESGIFKSALWSPDGTSIITSNADDVLRTFILPVDLLDAETPHTLKPYSSHQLPSHAYATAVHPAFSLSSPSTALFIASPAFLPIRLLSPFSPNIVASYPLINHLTEEYIAPHSLLFDPHSDGGSRFIAGSDSLISVFDLNRSGEGPISEIKTIPSRRKKALGGGVGMKGIVSTLAMSCEGILAAGTFTRWIGLYGRGGSMGVFELGKNVGDGEGVGEGKGLTQLLWSESGRYLCAAERDSDGISVWDIRGTGKRLTWLKGRNARTMQRLTTHAVGTDLWAGGTDGGVRLWEGVGLKEGVVEPDWDFTAHEDCVSSAALHNCGTILATCSGQRHESKSWSPVIGSSDESTEASEIDDLDSLQTIDNSLRIWTL